MRVNFGYGAGSNLDLPLEEGKIVRAILKRLPDEIARGRGEKVSGFYAGKPRTQFLQFGFVFLELAEGEMMPPALLAQLRVEIPALLEELAILVLRLSPEAFGEVGGFPGRKGGVEELDMAAPFGYLGFEGFERAFEVFARGKDADRVLKVESAEAFKLAPRVGAVRGGSGRYLIDEKQPSMVIHG